MARKACVTCGVYSDFDGNRRRCKKCEPVCLVCNKKFKANCLKQKYCSFKCGIKATGFQKGVKSWNWGTKGIMKPNSGSFRKGEFAGQKHPMWRGGHKFYRGYNWNLIAKAIIKEDRVCQDCGSSQRLQVHHLIPFRYWASAELGNQKANLITVCASCHMKADWVWQKQGKIEIERALKIQKLKMRSLAQEL